MFDSDVPVIVGNPPGSAGNRFAGDVNLIGNVAATFNNTSSSAMSP